MAAPLTGGGPRPRLRLVLADDEPLVIGGLEVVLGAQPDLEVVASAQDGVAALAAVRAHVPDVALVDLRMPGLGGVDVVRAVAREVPVTRTLVLTTFAADEDVGRALAAGAHGYVLKRSAPAELVHAIRVVAAGGSLVLPASARAGLTAPGRPDAAGPHAAALARLTDREREVLRLLARGRTNGEIAAELFLGRETVKTHVSAILAKLGARDRTHAVVIAYDSGFAR